MLHRRNGCGYKGLIRLDPVKSRVALPAADPPDNAHDTKLTSRRVAGRCVFLPADSSPMPSLVSLRRDWLANFRGDVLSGIVVALALIPEAIGFSVIAGVDPKVGLYASVVIASVIAFAGGRPAMIENAIASGMRASATTVPAKSSRVTLGAHSLRR